MENIIVGIILLGIVALAVRGSVKHFRGEGGCCGGSSAPAAVPEKRLTGKVVQTYTLTIDGMHCQNCANNIERAINRLDGAAAKVSLRKREAQVRCDRETDIARLIAAVEEKGYKIVSYKGVNADGSGL